MSIDFIFGFSDLYLCLKKVPSGIFYDFTLRKQRMNNKISTFRFASIRIFVSAIRIFMGFSEIFKEVSFVVP